MEPSLLDQGIQLMLVGMGTVFVFLTVLVFGMSTMSAITMRFTRSPVNENASDEEIAAITAAITQHRKNLTK